MMNMRFDVVCVKDCLRKYGVVFTVRSYDLDDCNVYVEGIGICKRIKGFEVKRKDDLVKFVRLSGFDNVDEWYSKICMFCGTKRKWIYKVKKI